jgi:hypothetical protein
LLNLIQFNLRRLRKLLKRLRRAFKVEADSTQDFPAARAGQKYADAAEQHS